MENLFVSENGKSLKSIYEVTAYSLFLIFTVANLVSVLYSVIACNSYAISGIFGFISLVLCGSALLIINWYYIENMVKICTNKSLLIEVIIVLFLLDFAGVGIFIVSKDLIRTLMQFDNIIAVITGIIVIIAIECFYAVSINIFKSSIKAACNIMTINLDKEQLVKSINTAGYKASMEILLKDKADTDKVYNLYNCRLTLAGSTLIICSAKYDTQIAGYELSSIDYIRFVVGYADGSVRTFMIKSTGKDYVIVDNKRVIAIKIVED